MSRTGRQCGQAAVEALALVPVLVMTLLIGWQLVVLINGSIHSQEAVRRQALTTAGEGVVTVRHHQRLPSVIPRVDGLELRTQATVRGR